MHDISVFCLHKCVHVIYKLYNLSWPSAISSLSHVSCMGLPHGTVLAKRDQVVLRVSVVAESEGIAKSWLRKAKLQCWKKWYQVSGPRCEFINNVMSHKGQCWDEQDWLGHRIKVVKQIGTEIVNECKDAPTL